MKKLRAAIFRKSRINDERRLTMKIRVSSGAPEIAP